MVAHSPWTSQHPNGSRQGHPRYTGAVTTEGRGWPEQRPKGEVTRYDASLKRDDRQVFRHKETHQKVPKRRSTRWWHSLQAQMTKEDPDNHTRWKHGWRWHNRGNVTLADKYKFATFALDSVKLLTVHRKNKGERKGKKVEEKTPGTCDPGTHHPHT